MESAYISTTFEVPQRDKNDHEQQTGNIIRDDGLKAHHDVISHGGAMFPFRHNGTKAFICKALGRVQERILSQLQMDEMRFGCSSRIARGLFVGMIQCGSTHDNMSMYSRHVCERY